jgi:transposase
MGLSSGLIHQSTYSLQRFFPASPLIECSATAAVKETWSNGPVEGHISRLKNIKRQMYGRAGFELLRARVLPLPQPASLHQK